MSNGVGKGGGGAGAGGGMITRVYKSGSIIYFAGDKSEKIYILKSGRVILTSVKPDTGAEVKEDVRKGEFFGVKSALGKYPREETAQTVGETMVLVLGLADFERLILKNVDIVRKMLRVFSNQLRRIGKMVRSVLGDRDNLNPDAELFNIGEYYYKAGVFRQAQYAFKRYMEYYPDGEFASTAMQRIKAIDSGEAVPGDTGFNVAAASKKESLMAEEKSAAGGGMDDFNDFSADDKGGGSLDDFGGKSDDIFGSPEGGSGGDKSSLTNEMDDFLTGPAPDSFDDFLSDSGVGESIADMFRDGSRLFSHEQYSEAMDIFEKVIRANPSSEADRQSVEDAHIEKGRCQTSLRQFKEAVETLSAFIKKYPQSKNVKKALFYIGSVFETLNQKDKAQAYFKKVAGMPPKDKISAEAASKVNQ